MDSYRRNSASTREDTASRLGKHTHLQFRAPKLVGMVPDRWLLARFSHDSRSFGGTTGTLPDSRFKLKSRYLPGTDTMQTVNAAMQFFQRLVWELHGTRVDAGVPLYRAQA